MVEMIMMFCLCIGGTCALVVVSAMLEKFDRYIKARYKMRYTPLEYVGYKMFGKR